MKVTLDLEFEIGDEVYHITPESPKGIILSWRYSSRNTDIEYEVIFGYAANDSAYCIAKELSRSKTF